MNDRVKNILFYRLLPYCGECGFKPENPGTLISTPDLVNTKPLELRPHPCPQCNSDKNILVRYEGVIRLEPKPK